MSGWPLSTLLVRTDAPPPEWTEAERHALANSILVEYVNSYDSWYKPKTGGILTDIDSMVQMTNLSYSVPGSCECYPACYRLIFLNKNAVPAQGTMRICCKRAVSAKARRRTGAAA